MGHIHKVSAGNVMFHMLESGEVILTFLLLAGGKLSFEAIGVISFTQTHYTTSIQQEIKLVKQAAAPFPGSVWLWSAAQGEYVSIGFCFDHSGIIFISIKVKCFLYSVHPGRISMSAENNTELLFDLKAFLANISFSCSSIARSNSDQ